MRSANLVRSRAMPDPRALKILNDTYWSSKGWKDPHSGQVRLPPPADFAYAKRQGLMFSHKRLSRPQIVRWLMEVRTLSTPRQVGNAFLASLSSRRLELRSALGSFAFARDFPDHRCDRRSDHVCSVCGLGVPGKREDLNVLNFERFKWGGIRHTNAFYAAFDLREFQKVIVPPPSREDLSILTEIIAIAASMKPTARATHLTDKLSGVLPSNDAERRSLLEVLSICGVLEPLSVPSYRTSFPGNGDVLLNAGSDSDWGYPIEFWRGKDGVNRAALREWFLIL